MTVISKIAEDQADSAELETKVSDALRRCLSTGEMKPRAELIRFVIGPDKAVFPDIAEKLPGHGLWVTATVDAIQLAVKKNLFAKAAKEPANPAPDLADKVTALLRRRCCEFLGLAKSAGIAVLGESQTESALRANKVALFLRAPDATKKIDNRYSTIECDLLTRDEMGAALGYDTIVYVGLLPHRLTGRLKQELARLRSMLSTEKSPVGTLEKNEG
jgi:predicted RNA-binding protein YlxR (DUF448 family)